MTAESSKVIEHHNSLKNLIQMCNNIILKVKSNAKIRTIEEFEKANSISVPSSEVRHPLGMLREFETCAYMNLGFGS